jgi:hypothetical protein
VRHDLYSTPEVEGGAAGRVPFIVEEAGDLRGVWVPQRLSAHVPLGTRPNSLTVRPRYRYVDPCIQILTREGVVGTVKSKGGGTRLVRDVRRKNLNIDQAKLDRVRQLLGASTETETIDEALSALLIREELIAGVRAIAGTGGVENVFADDSEP